MALRCAVLRSFLWVDAWCFTDWQWGPGSDWHTRFSMTRQGLSGFSKWPRPRSQLKSGRVGGNAPISHLSVLHPNHKTPPPERLALHKCRPVIVGSCLTLSFGHSREHHGPQDLFVLLYPSPHPPMIQFSVPQQISHHRYFNNEMCKYKYRGAEFLEWLAGSSPLRKFHQKCHVELRPGKLHFIPAKNQRPVPQLMQLCVFFLIFPPYKGIRKPVADCVWRVLNI